jgi:3-oxoadipate enol-lactonase
MFVRDTGSGRAILYLHDAPSSPYDFRPLIDALGPGRRALVPDMPGYGQSRWPDEGYSWQDSISGVEQALQSRDAQRLEAIVGVGAGAHRALAIALGGQVQTDAVVCLGGFATLEPSARTALAVMGQVIRGLPHLNDEVLQRFFVDRALAPGRGAADRALVDRVMGWLNETTPYRLGSELDALGRCEDLTPRLPKLRSRLLCRAGAQDQAVPVAQSQALCAGVHGATLQLVQGCGHALLLEDPEATSAAIAAFLSPQG